MFLPERTISLLGATLAFTICVLSSCNREAKPVVDIEKIAAEVDAQIAARHATQITAKESGGDTSVALLVEYIEVPMQLANDYISANPMQGNADAFRRQIQIWLKSDQAKLADMMLVSTRSGQRAKIQAITEIIYPEAFHPAKSGQEIRSDAGDQGSEAQPDESVIPPHPIRFKTRGTGTIMEIEPVSEKNGTIRIDINCELSFRLAENTWEILEDGRTATVEVPRFQNTIATTKVTVQNAGYALLGTGELPEEKRSPNFDDSILLIFLRADSF